MKTRVPLARYVSVAALLFAAPAAFGQTPVPNAIKQPGATGPFGQWITSTPQAIADANCVDAAANRSGEAVYVWRETTAINVSPGSGIPAVGQSFTVWCQRVNPDGSSRGSPIAVATNVFDSTLPISPTVKSIREQICPATGFGQQTWGPSVRCDIDDFGTVAIAWDHVHVFFDAVPTPPVPAPRVRVQYTALDFDSGNFAPIQSLQLNPFFIVNQLDVDVAIGQDYPGGLPTGTRMSFVYSADFGPPQGPGALPIRANIELVTVPVVPGLTPAFGLETGPVIVNSIPSAANPVLNSWGFHYLPAIEMDARGRAAVVWCEFDSCTGSTCNDVNVRMRRYLVGALPAYQGIYPLGSLSNPTTDFEIDGGGVAESMFNRPNLAMSSDGRIAVSWFSGSFDQRVATFGAVPGTFQAQMKSNTGHQTLLNTPNPTNWVRALALTEEGSLLFATVELTTNPGTSQTAHLYRMLGNTTGTIWTWSTYEVIPNVAWSPAWNHPTASFYTDGPPITQAPLIAIAASATGGADVVWRQSSQEIDRTRFDMNSIHVTMQSGGSQWTMNLGIPGAPSAPYGILVGTAPYYGSLFEDAFPDGRHSGTSLATDPLTATLLDPLNPLFPIFSNVLGSNGCAAPFVTGVPPGIGPLWFSVATIGPEPFPNNVLTFSVPEQVP